MKTPERTKLLLIGLLAAGAICMSAFAETPADFLNMFSREAAKEQPEAFRFSEERGKQFFQQTHGDEWSCASCHTLNPAMPGTHKVTRKEIAPLAPRSNPQRFTDAHKVEKWFRRNCKDVLGRECTAQEKGDVLVYLLSIR